MNRGANLKVALLAACVIVLVSTAGVAEQAATPQTPVHPVVNASRLRMQPDEALTFPGTTLNVAGDPSKPGIYVIRRRFTPGETSNPHYHDQDRFVTVIKGTWWTDDGNVKRPDRMIAVRTGGFMLHPAGLHHYDGAKDEEVIVQIIGMGPVKTVDVDAKGQPTGSR